MKEGWWAEPAVFVQDEVGIIEEETNCNVCARQGPETRVLSVMYSGILTSVISEVIQQVWGMLEQVRSGWSQ